MAHVPAVRRQSIRVALAATLVVGVGYLLIGIAVAAFASVTLTSDIDRRLVQAFDRVPPGGFPTEPPAGGQVDGPARDPGRPYGLRFQVWFVAADGTIRTGENSPDLPATLLVVTGPQTAVIDGTSMRVAGQDVGSGRMIVAQSLELVDDTQRSIVLGWLLIAPFLLGLVFVGAVIVGRRVAAPIEAARRRQLEFTADASHELRTPLSVIEAHTSLALAQERDAGWYRGAFVRVDRESKRMRRLLEDMLWLARFDAGAAPPTGEPVDLGVLAAQVADRFAAIAETRHLVLGVHVPPGQVLIAASAELVDRLIGVLVDNACKYAPDGGSVDLTVAAEGSRATVTVDDSGPGIPEEDRQRVFHRFHRSVTTSSEVPGAGLGLAIGDAIVHATGARWTVGTSPAGGARFTVTWSRASVG